MESTLRGKMMTEILPVREQILSTARDYTIGDRDQSYGDPIVNLSLARHLKSMCWTTWTQNSPRMISPAEWEAIDMILVNIARLVVGPAPGRDRYIDIAGYAAIAGEAEAAYSRMEEQANADND